MILAVIGPKGCGKSTLLERAAVELQRLHLSVGGVISLSHIRTGRRVGYDILTLPDRQKELLAVEKSWASVLAAPEDSLEYRAYSFDFAALEKGRQAISAGLQADCLFIDEVGFWELEGGGWGVCMASVARRAQPVVIGLRREIIPQLDAAWGIKLAGIIDLENTTAAQAFETIIETVTIHCKGAEQ